MALLPPVWRDETCDQARLKLRSCVHATGCGTLWYHPHANSLKQLGHGLAESGQFEYLERTETRLAIVAPLALELVFLLLYTAPTETIIAQPSSASSVPECRKALPT